MRISRRWLIGSGIAAAVAAGGGYLVHRALAAPARRVACLLPDKGNAQFLAFWIAYSAGHFAAEGIDLEIVMPEHPRLAAERFTSGAAPLAVLPPPLYFSLLADGVPLRLVANLLRRDAICMVLTPSRAAELPAPGAPLEARIEALRGLRIGMASGPDERLVALLAAGGLERDDVDVVELPGPQQNPAFAEGRVDALFAHTPFLERAIARQGGSCSSDLPRVKFPRSTNCKSTAWSRARRWSTPLPRWWRAP